MEEPHISPCINAGLTFDEQIEIMRKQAIRKLRDDIALEAMKSMLINVNEPNFKVIAEWSYEMADAMMEERAK